MGNADQENVVITGWRSVYDHLDLTAERIMTTYRHDHLRLGVQLPHAEIHHMVEDYLPRAWNLPEKEKQRAIDYTVGVVYRRIAEAAAISGK